MSPSRRLLLGGKGLLVVDVISRPPSKSKRLSWPLALEEGWDELSALVIGAAVSMRSSKESPPCDDEFKALPMTEIDDPEPMFKSDNSEIKSVIALRNASCGV